MSLSHAFFVSLERALRAGQLYQAGHPRLAETIAALDEAYTRVIQNKPRIQVALRNSRLFVDKVPEASKHLLIKAIIQAFEDREINAMLIYPGATREELQSLVDTLNFAPELLREHGGAKKMMEDKGVKAIHILAARPEEISEVGEITAALLNSLTGIAGAIERIPSKSQTALPPADSAAEARPPLPFLPSIGTASPGAGGGRGPDTSSLVAQVKNFVASLAGGTLEPADLSSLGAFLHGAGMDQMGVQPGTQGVVKQALAELSPEQQLDIFLGAGRMHPGSLRNLITRVASAHAAPSLASAFVGGALSQNQLAETSEELKKLSASHERWGDQIIDALRREGMSGEQLRDLAELITWEDQPMATKVAKLLEGQRIFEMPQNKVLPFLRELLEAGSIQEFLRLVRHYATGLMVPAVARRLSVAQGFAQISDWVDIPGMPHGVITDLVEIISTSYGREKDPEVHAYISKSMEHFLWFYVQKGEPALAHDMFMDLQDVVTELSLPAHWKAQASADLLSRLGTPERVNQVLDQLFVLERSAAAAKIHPYLKMLGSSAANHLAERLSEETDRAHRGRLVEALKACGQVAEAPLLESLKSPEWYVIRNALTVLAEVAGQDRVHEIEPFLGHGDFRVCRAAIRAMGHIGGRQAEMALIAALNNRNPERQMEVLFVLGEMKSKQAVASVIELVKSHKWRTRLEQERVREKAVEVLGSTGSPSVIPLLRELLVRTPGFFRETKEPLPIRLAALRALISLDSIEAQEAIGKALDAEPDGPERNALRNAITETLAGPHGNLEGDDHVPTHG